jgi:CDP-diacylglycerol--glycerol-3-phosphate 3-phosphatidyltransferase/cardiolipin synthase
MAQLGKAKSVAVSFIGKLKTTAQMVAIFLLVWSEPIIPGVSTHMVGTIAMYIAAILTIWSMFYYLRVAAEQFKDGAS